MGTKQVNIWIHLLTNDTLDFFFFLSYSLLLFLLLHFFPLPPCDCPIPSGRFYLSLSSPFLQNPTATDLQFARTSEGHPVPFATAGDCYSAAKCPQVCAGGSPDQDPHPTHPVPRGTLSCICSWECCQNSCSGGPCAHLRRKSLHSAQSY